MGICGQAIKPARQKSAGVGGGRLLKRGPSLSNYKPVPGSPDRTYILRLGRVLLDFLPDPGDVYRNRGRIAKRIHPPNPFKQLFLAKYPVGILQKKQKQVEFLMSQRYFFPVHKNLLASFWISSPLTRILPPSSTWPNRSFIRSNLFR